MSCLVSEFNGHNPVGVVGEGGALTQRRSQGGQRWASIRSAFGAEKRVQYPASGPRAGQRKGISHSAFGAKSAGSCDLNVYSIEGFGFHSERLTHRTEANGMDSMRDS